MVMLEWGSCGQVATAVRRRTQPRRSAVSGLHSLRAAGGGAAGGAISDRAGVCDAVLLTSMGVELGQASRRLAAQPARPGDRRVGPPRRPGAGSLRAHTGRVGIAGSAGGGPLGAAGVGGLGDCSVERCIIDADFLQDVGFVVVAPHRYFPRLRLELDKGLGWKAEVEADWSDCWPTLSWRSRSGRGRRRARCVIRRRSPKENGEVPPSLVVRSTASS